MKLTSDRSLIGKDRRIVTFMLEDGDGLIETAYALAGVFEQTCAVISTPFGEHRLPAEKCRCLQTMYEALGEVNITGIEIGEGKGRSDIFFLLNNISSDLTCIGPLDYDFYALLRQSGLDFTL